MEPMLLAGAGVVVALVAAYLIWRNVRTVLALIANGAVGVLALLAVAKLAPGLVVIDQWTVIASAVGGLPGLLGMILLRGGWL
jgi:hypothetical protein